MRKEVRLTSSQSVQSVNTDFPVVAISIENPTASPIYVRLGAPDTPTVQDADRTIPAAESRVVAASGQVFCFALANAALLAQSASTVGGLFTVANIILLSEGEIVPSFGSASFLSLSTSQLSNGAQSFAPSPPANVYDLGPWGGAIFYFYPTSASGQTNIRLNVSNDAVTWYPLGSYALWPGVPSTITVPRLMRYVNMEIFATGISGEPNPAGTFYVRGSLAEITDLVYTPTTTPIIKAVNIVGIGSQQFSFMTAGLPAVSLAYIATAGTSAGAQVTLLVEASADLVNWRKVTDRTQSMSQGITLYRALGNLDLFVRVTIFQNVAAQTEIGSLYASIPTQADLGYILNTIQQSLGDTGAPTNTNQDIYHELDSIRAIENSYLPAINTTLGGISALDTLIEAHTLLSATVENTNLPYLPAINTTLGGISAIDALIQTNTINAYNVQNTNLPGIKTDTANLANIKTDTANLASILTTANSLRALPDGLGTPFSGSSAVVAGTWLNIATLSGAAYVEAIQMTVRDQSFAGLCQMALGTAFAPSTICYTLLTSASGLIIGPTVQFGSPRTGGLCAFTAFNLNYLWIRHTVSAATLGYNIEYSS